MHTALQLPPSHCPALCSPPISPSLLPQSPEAELLKEETAELEELFRLVDRDGGGTISMDEFMELLAAMSVRPSPHEMSLLFAEIDSNDNRLLELTEFMDFMQHTVVKKMRADDVNAAFALFEGFASSALPGRISRRDLELALNQYAPDHISTQGKSERRSVIEDRSRRAAGAGGGAADLSLLVDGNSEERQRVLEGLLDALDWDEDGYCDYGQFVASNTGTSNSVNSTERSEQ